MLIHSNICQYTLWIRNKKVFQLGAHCFGESVETDLDDMIAMKIKNQVVYFGKYSFVDPHSSFFIHTYLRQKVL